MGGVAARVSQAAVTHRNAVAIAAAAGAVLEGYAARPRSATTERSIRELAERLRVAAGLLVPGWLGAPLDAVPASTPLGTATSPGLVRIGTAYPLDDTSFPVVVPLGHLALDGDARDPRVARALRAVLLRLLASVRPGSLQVRGVDPAEVTFGPFAPLHDVGILPPPVTDRPGLCAVLSEAEQWVRSAGDRPAGRTLLLVVATWPEETEPTELTRLSVLATEGPAAGLHLLLAGWPPLLLGEDATEPMTLENHRPGPPLPHATRVTLRNPYAVVGHPPDGSFATPVPAGHSASPGLNAQVFLDEPPSADLVTRICRDVAAEAARHTREALLDVLPDRPMWSYDGSAGLEVVIGRAGDTPVPLRLDEPTPHWLLAGAPGSGKSTLLRQILYGLCSRYDPGQLSCYLLDLRGGGTFTEFVPRPGHPAQLPHARAVAVAASPAEVTAVLGRLRAELARRHGRPAGSPLPNRIVCLVDEAGEVAGSETGGESAGGDEATELLAELVRAGGRYGIHLVLAGRSRPPAEVVAGCPVRILLPGGTRVLNPPDQPDPPDQDEDGLTLGTAMLITAAGAAEGRLVRFPDPDADPAAGVGLAGLRHRWWRTGSPGGAA